MLAMALNMVLTSTMALISTMALTNTALTSIMALTSTAQGMAQDTVLGMAQDTVPTSMDLVTDLTSPTAMALISKNISIV